MSMPDDNKITSARMSDLLKLKTELYDRISSLDERVKQMEKGFFDLDARIKVDASYCSQERNKVLNVVLQQLHKEHPTTKDGECMLRRCKEIVQQELDSPLPEEGAQPGSIMDTMYNLKRILKEDPGYRKSWKDNIAMAFKDEMDREIEKMPINDNSIHEAANNAAEQFLQLLEKK